MVAELEMKYAMKIDVDAKILAGVFRGRSFNCYADLRTGNINYLDDKVCQCQ